MNSLPLPSVSRSLNRFVWRRREIGRYISNMGCHLPIRLPNLGRKTCHGDPWAAGHSMRAWKCEGRMGQEVKEKKHRDPDSRL